MRRDISSTCEVVFRMPKLIEQAISWDPVPRYANIYMLLTVERLERAIVEGMPLSMIVVAQTEKSPRIIGRWRIDFLSVAAFRCLPIDQPNGHGSVLVARDTSGQLSAATWEVVHSRWLPEAIGTLHSRPQAIHHYVIADTYVVYDIAAQWWTSEMLEDRDD
jgi:hypothetical protein